MNPIIDQLIESAQAPSHSSDQQQMTDGCYRLYQGDKFVGALRVEDGGSVEHWYFTADYVKPSVDGGTQSLTFEPAASCAAPAGLQSGTYIVDDQAFAVREYIRAECVSTMFHS
jgi:hypothetical protein